MGEGVHQGDSARRALQISGHKTRGIILFSVCFLFFSFFFFLSFFLVFYLFFFLFLLASGAQTFSITANKLIVTRIFSSREARRLLSHASATCNCHNCSQRRQTLGRRRVRRDGQTPLRHSRLA